MSGVLIKTGIYGLTRVFFDFLGTPPNWWGVTILTIGTVSALLGVLYALMEHDLKRLLAYHSIENIGIILMGLGAALMFLRAQYPAGLVSVMHLPGFGPRRARRLYDELGVDSLDALRAAAEQQKIRGLRGFGAKVEETLLKVQNLMSRMNAKR